MNSQTNTLHKVICATLLVIIFMIPASIQAQSIPPIESILWSPDGVKLATGHEDGTLRIWNTGNGSVLHIIQAHPDRVITLGWKSDNSQIISGGFDTDARVWDVNTGLQLATLPDISSSAVMAVGWTLDNQQIFTWGFDTSPNNFYLWDAETFAPISAERKAGDIIKVVWSPDKTKAALANAAGAAGTVNATTFEILQSMPEPETPSGGTFGVYTVAWSPDGMRVVSGNYAGIVRLWNANTGEHLLDLQATDSETIDWSITAVRVLFFSTDGSQVSSLTADGTLRTWEVSSGHILSTTYLTDTPIFAADLSPDGTKLAYGGAGGTIQILPLQDSPVCHSTQTVSEVTELISAINTANANPDADVIGLAAGTYTFTSIHNNRNALPRITTDITICSTDGATLTRSPSAPQFRLFEVRLTGKLTLENLTLTNGSLGVDDDGGAIYNLGTLTVNSVTFSNNQAGVGGAIASEDGQVSVTDSTFTNNASTGDGGAIHSEADLLIETSTFTGNTADDAGAVNNDGGDLTVTNSTFTDNSADDGGAIYNDAGTLTLSGSTFTDNTGDAGGALDNLDGQAQIGSSTFTGNSASDGGAIRNYGGTIILTTSRFTGNTATDDGGALNNSGGTLTITDTRLENNTATTRGGAMYSNSSGTMSAHNSCISGNSATAVYAASTGLQDFTGNWWGAANGPGGAGPGSGDTINSKINYANFLTTGCPLP